VRIPVEALARRVIEHVAILIGLRTSSADGDHAVIDEQLPGTLLTGRTAAPLR
jgi:hypothetical protein